MNLSTQEQRDIFFADFEKQGESAVRIATLSPAWNNDRFLLGMATEWLRLKDEERALAASAKRDAREARTLRLAMWANIIAITALIIAGIAVQKEIWSLITMILQWLGVFEP